MDNRNTYSTAFLLRTAKAKKGKAPIYCRITVNGQRTELKNYFTTQNYVKEFLTIKLQKRDIHLSQLSYQFITGLEMFLKAYQPKDHRKPMGQNTVMKHIERLRKMVNLAIKHTHANS